MVSRKFANIAFELILAMTLALPSCSMLLDVDDLARSHAAQAAGDTSLGGTGTSVQAGGSTFAEAGRGGTLGQAGSDAAGGGSVAGADDGGSSGATAGGEAGLGGNGGTVGGSSAGGISGQGGETGSGGTWGTSVYSLVARHSGKCLDVSNQVRQQTCDASGAQGFRLVPDGNYLHLVNVESNKCLRVNGTSDGVYLDEYTCNDHNNKDWTIEEIEGGFQHVVNRYANRCAHVQNGELDDGTPIYAWPCSTNTTAQHYRQHWTIEPRP